MMIDSCLNHNITFKHFTKTGAQDEYGQPLKTETVVSEKCFFDIPKEEINIRLENKELVVEALVFMKKDSQIAVDDEVNAVKDADGNDISTLLMRVGKVGRASDFERVTHLEVSLVKK